MNTRKSTHWGYYYPSNSVLTSLCRQPQTNSHRGFSGQKAGSIPQVLHLLHTCRIVTDTIYYKQAATHTGFSQKLHSGYKSPCARAWVFVDNFLRLHKIMCARVQPLSGHSYYKQEEAVPSPVRTKYSNLQSLS